MIAGFININKQRDSTEEKKTGVPQRVNIFFRNCEVP